MAGRLAEEEEMDPQLASITAGVADLRILLTGQTGVGKSAAGNTILGRKAFLSTISPSSVTSECKKEIREFEGQTLAVIDTPGLFDTSEDHIRRELKRFIFFSSPGPHVFLIVIQPNRFTSEEQETVKLIQEMFGEEAADYTMALFTRGDDLKADGISIERIINSNKALHDFIRQCRGGYHVFDNRDKDVSQVRELLNKINRLVQRNEGRCFTNEMFRKAERNIKQVASIIVQQNPDMEIQEARRQAESNYTWGAASSSLTTSGAALGSLRGPMGIAVGAAVVVIAFKLPKDGCIIQ